MDEVLIRRTGCAGRITLNRPAALNALTHGMCLAIEAALRDWVDDADVALVVIDGAGDKAFCAGGDIVAIHAEGMAGRDAAARAFWRDEYRLNALIAEYPKPYVALMDGFVMGGGVGVSAHGSHRVVTGRTQLAMPECGIGLIPDVGGTHLLAAMPGRAGEYAGLTGARLSGSDCLYGGLADHLVDSARLAELVERLCETGATEVIKDFAAEPDPSWLAEHQGEIDAVFGLPDMGAIHAALAGGQSDFARRTAKALSRGAPLCLRVTLDAIREARRKGDLREALRHEYRFVSIAVLEGEFLEGIRAALIDRDHSPRWRWPEPGAVPEALIQRLRQPAEGGDLDLSAAALKQEMT